MTSVLSITRSSFLLPIFFSLLFGPTLWASDVQNTPLVKADLQKHAEEKYRALMGSFSSLPSQHSIFWQIGMAADAMIDHCQNSQIDCQKLGKITLEIFTMKAKSQEKYWWDDYGWWGWSFVRLYKKTKDPQYLNAANVSFSNMLSAKYAWKDCQEFFKISQTPLFENGCYNAPLVNQTDSFQGIQNTVTNAQFLRLSLALFAIYYQDYLTKPTTKQADTIKVYWTEAMEQYHWFLQWFKEGLMNKSFAGEHHILIEERVKKYQDQTNAYSYCPNRFWIGDQGLLMASLTDLHTIFVMLSDKNPLKLDVSKLDNNLINNAIGIAKGVKMHLVDQNNILSSYKADNQDRFPFADAADYLTGPGVYLCSMIHCAHNNESLMAKFAGNAYKTILDKNARTAIKNPHNINGIDSFTVVANDLAALNAAIALMK
jgi:hypothetical protein